MFAANDTYGCKLRKYKFRRVRQAQGGLGAINGSGGVRKFYYEEFVGELEAGYKKPAPSSHTILPLSRSHPSLTSASTPNPQGTFSALRRSISVFLRLTMRLISSFSSPSYRHYCIHACTPRIGPPSVLPSSAHRICINYSF